MRGLILALLIFGCCPATAQKPVVLVVTADAEDYLLAAGGTIGAMIENGAEAHILRVTNDENSAWDLSPEETAVRIKTESESAASALGAKEVVSIGYSRRRTRRRSVHHLARPLNYLHSSLPADSHVHSEPIHGVRSCTRPLLHRTRRGGCLASCIAGAIMFRRSVRSD